MYLKIYRTEGDFGRSMIGKFQSVPLKQIQGSATVPLVYSAENKWKGAADDVLYYYKWKLLYILFF